MLGALVRRLLLAELVGANDPAEVLASGRADLPGILFDGVHGTTNVLARRGGKGGAAEREGRGESKS
ncbi:MAG TPA: hypothetical protein VIL30_13040 [Ramlibacter sp.]